MSIRRYGRKLKRAIDRLADTIGFIIKIALGVAGGIALFVIAAPYIAG